MAENDLQVILKAKALAKHTLQITSNCNRFPKKYRFSLVDKMQNKALEIYEYLHEANQTAQVHALLTLDCIDHMITGELGISLYGRYMDDFYLIHHDKEYLKYCLEHIREMVSSLNLELNGKTQIVPFKNGISFLGFHHYVTRDGKYIRKLKGEKKRAIKKKLTVWTRLVNTGRMPEEKFWQKYNAFKNHALKGNCIKMCCELDRFVENRLSCQRN